jgi:hypothetical protein
MSMTIERTDTEVIIRLPAYTDTRRLENFLRHERYKELTSKSKVSQKEVDKLVKEVKKGWWAKNRNRLIKNH